MIGDDDQCGECIPPVCDGLDPDPNCPDEAFDDIFENIPSFMATTEMQDAVCALSASEREDLLYDVLAYQTEIWNVTSAQFAVYMGDLDDLIVELLEYHGLDGQYEEECYRAFFIGIVKEYWVGGSWQ
jgi:hypothetical protein